MAPFSIPTPSIIPLRLPVFGGPKSIDTDTKVQLLCETFLEHEIFYTLDGTKPQPYAGIVQGNKTIKYIAPFCLPPGKITIKAIAINANIHTMCSNVVTKCFEVLKSETYTSAKKKTPGKPKLSKCDTGSKKSNCQEKICASNKFNSKNVDCNKNDILENAFVGSLESKFESCTLDLSLDSQPELSATDSLDGDISDSIGLDGSECDKSNTILSGITNLEYVNDDDDAMNSFEALEKSVQQSVEKIQKFEPDFVPSTTNSQSGNSQFCCIKCDMTLQQCFSCHRMNAISSKFCIGCGSQLIRICFNCEEFNPAVASFCQSCGKKLRSAAVKLEFSSKIDSGVMAKPKSKNASIQKLPDLEDKCTQTLSEKTFPKKTPSKHDKKISPNSPGRGYWHLQIDYICNHLKSHAYNDLEFRKTISEPALCNFKSAQVTKDNENVTVTVVFSPLLLDKTNPNESGELKSKDSS